jgi:hypothetical protein
VVFFATSDVRTELLGHRLVAAGRITPVQLARALEVREAEHEGGRRLGEIMIDHQMITLPVLEEFVQEQIQDTIFDLFLWDTGEFEFELLQAPPQDQDIGLSVSVENIIMESARRLSELSKMRSTAAGSRVVYRLSAAPGEGTVDIALTPSEWRVVALTDGSRTVSEIAAAAGLSELDVARTLHGLLGAGLLEVVQDAAPDSVLEPAPAAPGPMFQPLPRPEPESEPEPEPEREPRPAPAPQPVPSPEPPRVPAPTPAPLRPDSGITMSGLLSGLSEELTALTAESPGARSRVSAATPASAAGEAGRLVHLDARVSRETIEAVLQGVEKL